MLTDILTVIAGLLSAVLVGFVARRVLDTPVGWPRSIVVGLIVFVTGLPFAAWVLGQTTLLPNGETDDVRDALLATAVIALSVAWVFAAGVATLVALEGIFPTRPLPNPIDVVRGALRQRKRTRRYLQILAIASRHGAGWLFRGRSRVEEHTTDTTSVQRAAAIVATINDAGVSFVKLGQVLSTRRDLLPEPYLGALSSLQTNATTLPWSTIRDVIEHDLGAPLDTVFAAIDPEPLAAASVAQVHTAELLDGTPVVVKVQRPAAREQVEADVDIILRLAHRAETHTRMGHDLRLESVARGFTSTLLEELDYRVEARNMAMIRSTLDAIDEADPPRAGLITVPQVYATGSGQRMLTMGLVDGVPLSHAAARLAELDATERERLATVLMSTVIEQILVYGVFHADLHPGNVILRDDATLGLIDLGAIGIVERSARQHLAALLLAALSENDMAATDALLLIVDVPDDVDVDAFRHDIGIVLTTERFASGADGSIFTRVVDVIRQHRIALPGDLASAFRSFATLEGCLRVLVPDFDMVGRALPLVPVLLRRMVSLRRFATNAQAEAAITSAMMRTLPRRIDALLSGLERGTVGVRLRADDGDQGFLRSLVSESIGTVVSVAAVVIAVVLLVNGAGPDLGGGLGLFDLLGAIIGLFGFLGLLRVVRQLFARHRR